MESERKVGGLWCSEVLTYLSEFRDNELPPATTAQIEAHLAECDWCEKFGTQFSSMMTELVKEFSVPDPLSESLQARLLQALSDLGRSSGPERNGN